MHLKLLFLWEQVSSIISNWLGFTNLWKGEFVQLWCDFCHIWNTCVSLILARYCLGLGWSSHHIKRQNIVMVLRMILHRAGISNLFSCYSILIILSALSSPVAGNYYYFSFILFNWFCRKKEWTTGSIHLFVCLSVFPTQFTSKHDLVSNWIQNSDRSRLVPEKGKLKGGPIFANFSMAIQGLTLTIKWLESSPLFLNLRRPCLRHWPKYVGNICIGRWANFPQYMNHVF